MRIIFAAALAALTLLPPTQASAEIADSVRLRAEQACYDDVNRICADSIPDEDRIKACMKVHRAQLSPKCKAIFEANTR